jgi:L-methionine (R)-S-oxide reductase
MDQTFERPPVGDKETIYKETLKQLESLLAEDNDLLASLANTTALLKLNLGSFSWVGFYLASHGELVVGPFQGKPACTRIELGKGVCGTAAEKNETIIVPDVSKFPGHIACDVMSRSEIVVPIQVGEKVVGVLDVDSQNLSNFDETDKAYLERVVEILKPKFKDSDPEAHLCDA